jgi:hypothetical protein
LNNFYENQIGSHKTRFSSLASQVNGNTSFSKSLLKIERREIGLWLQRLDGESFL